MPNLGDVTELFEALADPTRLRIVYLMAANNEELCVCELVECLEEPQYHISRHLRELRNCGLLNAQRDGRWMYYSLNKRDPLVRTIAELIAALSPALFAAEQRNFKQRMKLRVGGRCHIGIQKRHLSESVKTEGAGSLALAL